MESIVYNDFADEWIQSWNSHDLETIMSHYSEKLEFSSPVIQQMGVNENGFIITKNDLKDYFKKALQKYPELKFELLHILKGVSSFVLFYKSINNMYAAEYMELDKNGKVTRVKAHYANGNL